MKWCVVSGESSGMYHVATEFVKKISGTSRTTITDN